MIFCHPAGAKTTAVKAVAKSEVPGGVVPATPDLDYFIGYDTAKSLSKGSKCVEYSEPLPIQPPSPPQTMSLDLDQGSSFQQFFEKQNLSASASFGYAGFSADASYAMMSQSQMSKFSEYLRITVSVENQRTLLDVSKIKWTPFGLSARTQGTLYDQCGDGFVIGSITGGDLSVVYNASSETTSEQQTSAATLNAAYSSIGAQGSLGAAVGSELDKMNTEGKLKVTILREGPNEALTGLSPQALISYALTYNKQVATTPWTTGYIIASYDAVPDGASVTVQDDPTMDQRALVIRSMYQRLAGLDYMMKNPSEFGGFNIDRATADFNSLQSSIEQYREAVNSCLSAGKGSCAAPVGSVISDVPDRPLINVIDVHFSGYQQVGQAIGDESLVVENLGSWSNSPGSWISNTDYPNTWKFVNMKNGNSFSTSFKAPMKLPPDSTAYFHIVNTPAGYPGAAQSQSDPAETWVFRPLYDDDYAYPQGWDATQWSK
jgi:hypothetical protein